MKRRSLLAAGGVLLAPVISRAQAVRPLRFVPQTDVGVLDPSYTTAYVTRNHAYMIFDTLFGVDDHFRAHPQMVEGVAIENDGRLWRLTLRDGLKFHDDTPVLARDAVASIQRWWRRDAFGQELLAATDELSAPSDKVIQFRLKRPFPLLPAALGKPSSYMPAIMPERLAAGPADRQIPELIGSGPFRFNRAEFQPGNRLIYDRFAGYVPRCGGTASRTSGPKVVHLDRVEWVIIPDPATAASALNAGEVDWVERPLVDLLPMLRRNRAVEVKLLDPEGALPILRVNQLQAPFDNPEVRRILLRSITQSDFLRAAAGDDTANWHDNVGIFTPGTPLANNAGMEVMRAPRDLARSRRELVAAGYANERVVILSPGDYPQFNAMAQVGADLLKRIGFNVDLQVVDWGTVQQRRLKKEPVDQGGWSIYFTTVAGNEAVNPAAHQNTRGLGERSNPGWPLSPKLEEYRAAWFAAKTPAEQLDAARRIQDQVFVDVPFVPLGQFFEPNAIARSVSGIPGGFPVFWNLRKA
ncbi:MAG: transporter substrate-binding protein [Rubritepida sp.]|nr:transporter substrate-binding protein [Rubritepida sp.]